MNPMDILKNFQNIQARMQEVQQRLKDTIVVGTAGGGMVSIEMNGQMEVVKVHVDPVAVDPNDVEMLQDLLLAGFTDAMAKVKEKLREEMSEVTGGMPMPPGFMGT
jgi:hypothetical protein